MLILASVLERIAYGNNIAAVSAMLTFRLVAARVLIVKSSMRVLKLRVSLAIRAESIADVSAIFNFRMVAARVLIVKSSMRVLKLRVSLAIRAESIADVSAMFTFKASAASALAFSVLMLASVFERIAYGNNIAAVSATFTFPIVSEVLEEINLFTF